MQALIEKIRRPYVSRLSETLGVTEGLLYRRGNFNGTGDQLLVDGRDAMVEQLAVGTSHISAELRLISRKWYRPCPSAMLTVIERAASTIWFVRRSRAQAGSTGKTSRAMKSLRSRLLLQQSRSSNDYIVPLVSSNLRRRHNSAERPNSGTQNRR